MTEKYVTLREARRLTGKPHSTIHYHIKNGTVRHIVRWNGLVASYLVDIDDVRSPRDLRKQKDAIAE